MEVLLVFTELKDYLKKDFVVLFVFSAICWYFVHGTMIFYPVFNHDGITSGSFYFFISIERPLQAIWDVMKGEFRVLNITSLWAVLAIALSVFYIKKIFNINSLFFCSLICMVIVTSLSTIIWVATYKAVDFILIAYMFAILSTYFLLQKSKIYILLSSLYLGLSISMYQAEMQVFVTLNAICLLISFLKRDIIPMSYSHYVIKCIIVMLLGVSFYIFFSYICHIIFNIPSIKGYNSPLHVFDLNLSKVLNQVLSAYVYFFAKIKEYIHYANFAFKWVTLTILILSIIMYYIYAYLVKLNYKKVILSMLLWALLPLSVVCIWIVSFGVTAEHCLLSLTLMMCLPFFIYNSVRTLEIKKHFSFVSVALTLYKVFIFCIVLTIYYNAVYANGLYQRQHANFIATTNLYSLILNDLHKFEGFVPTKTKVLLIGDLDSLDINKCTYGSVKIKDNELYNYNITGIWNKCKSTSYYGTVFRFIEYLGYNLKMGTDSDINNMLKIEEFKKMPTYPNKGYMKFINGMLVVKIGKR